MQQGFDVVIIGAGPAGSSAAILLARAGWSVALVEKQRFPRRKVCGECVAASNLPLLDALGIGRAFADAAGAPLRRMALMHAGEQVVADLPAAMDAAHPWGRALGREVLDSLLLDQARRSGAVIFQPWLVQAIDGGPGDWQLQLRKAETSESCSLEARVAIAAHGSWEALPSERDEARAMRRPSDLLAFKANFRHARLDQGLLPVLALEGGYGGMVVGDHGITTLACCIRRDRLDAARRERPGLAAGEVVERWLRRQCLGVDAALSSAQREGPWLASGPLRPGVRLAASDRLLRIGNAAGEAHPIVGEGMSMALQSAWLLCARLLAAGSATEAASADRHARIAAGYAADWRHHFRQRLFIAASFAQAASRPASARLLMTIAQRLPALLTVGARWSSKDRSAIDAASIRRMTPTAAWHDRPTTTPS